MMQFFGARRRFLDAPAIYQVDLFGAHAHRYAHGIHGGISRADDGYAFAHSDRSVVQRLPESLHEVDAGQKFVGRNDAVIGLSRDSHEFRAAGAGGNEHRVVPLFLHQLRNRKQLADDAVELELDSQSGQALDFDVDGVVGKTEFRNPVFQHAARDMERLIDGHIHARLDQIAGTGEPGRPGTDNCGLLARLLELRRLVPASSHGKIGHKSFQASDGDRFELVADDAGRLALHFLRTDAAADRRQRIGAFENSVGFLRYLCEPARR